MLTNDFQFNIVNTIKSITESYNIYHDINVFCCLVDIFTLVF